MIPDERSLVAEFAQAPFTLIGVNSDSNLDEVRPELDKAGITWRSFWNGPQGQEGPIAQAWGIQGWPTIYVIDAQGRIRYRDLRGAELEHAVEALLAELVPGPARSAR